MRFIRYTVRGIYKNLLKLEENSNFFTDFKLSYAMLDAEDVAFICLLGNKIIALDVIHKIDNNIFSSLFLEVLPSHRSLGISKILLKERYQFLKENKYQMHIDNYTKDGISFLSKNDVLFAKQFNINLTYSFKLSTTQFHL